jgi:hypothetical protein
MLKQMLKEYFDLQKKIHTYFGYTEDWVTIPLLNGTEYFWSVCETKKIVYYHENPLTQDSVEGGAHYSGRIYTQRFLPKWVYRSDRYTMVSVDTQTDGNKYLMVFDNDKECPDAINFTFQGWG